MNKDSVSVCVSVDVHVCDIKTRARISQVYGYGRAYFTRKRNSDSDSLFPKASSLSVSCGLVFLINVVTKAGCREGVHGVSYSLDVEIKFTMTVIFKFTRCFCMSSMIYFKSK